MYKLLALDLDGTLLRRDGTIHPEDFASIERLKQRGVPVTIITGRLYSGSRKVAHTIKIEGPIACVDGSHIVNLRDDSALFHHSIVGKDATVLRDVLERHRTASFLFAQDSIVHDSTGEPFASYVRTWSPNIDVVERLIAHPYWEHEEGLMAVVSIGPEGYIAAAILELSERLAHAASVFSFPLKHLSGLFAMVVRAKGSSKGTALAWMAQHHGCTVTDVVAVGDWLNDKPMFEVAGRSFAMRQAPKELKEIATDQLNADGYVGGGIAEAIRRAWGTL